MIKKIFEALLNFLWQYTLKPKDNFQVCLGDYVQKGALIAFIYPEKIWFPLSLKEKTKAILKHKWKPSRDETDKIAEKVFIEDYFGEDDDCGYDLLVLNAWVNREVWGFHDLTPEDIKKAFAISVSSLNFYTQLKGVQTNPSLNLSLNRDCPHICSLLYPIAIRTPIISIKYFVDVKTDFSFNEIRKSKHPYASDLINILYDILFTQQKTALAIMNFLKTSHQTVTTKDDSLLSQSELEAIVFADILVIYLKSTVEKILSFLGYLFQAKEIDNKKTHKKRLEMLLKKIPNSVMVDYYADFLFSMVQTDNFEKINNLRTGIIHKRGISVLQPHSYVDIPPKENPQKKLFHLLHDYHSRNSAALIATLAILTDDLVKRNPVENPEFVQEELNSLHLKTLNKQKNAQQTAAPDR